MANIFSRLFKTITEPRTTEIPGPRFKGERPFSAAQVGLDAENTLSPLSKQFARQIMERSQGQGLVGFDPEFRKILRGEFIQDLEDTEEEERRRQSAQASGQGLRGGIPLDISQRRAKDFSRARASGLADIDVADLQARRDDINRATYAQPELVNLGSNIQNQRSAFDLAINQFEQPELLIEPSLLNLAAQGAGLAAATAAGSGGGGGGGQSIFTANQGGAGFGTGSNQAGAFNNFAQPQANNSLARNPFLAQFEQDPFFQTRQQLRRY